MRDGRTVRVASGQGFWGDWQEAPKLQVRHGPVDYLMMDYLAEITMSIMQKQRERDPEAGYARDFVPLMEELAGDLLERGVRVVTNAGGVNPGACRDALLRATAEQELPRPLKVGVVSGDGLLDRLDDLLEAGHQLRNMETGAPLEEVRDRVRAANAYLGAEPIVEAVGGGADIVVTGRATDTALTYAPLIHEFSWPRDAWDRLAAGVVAGHINECGAQATGGNTLYDWRSMDLVAPGYPIIEAGEDGTFVVTKHPELGGRVNWATVTEQLVYEMGDPTEYVTPDCVADFSTIRLDDLGDDRVRVHGVRGRPRPERLKVSIAYVDGYKASGTLTYAWPEAYEKAQRADEILRGRLQRLGLEFDEIRTEFIGAGAAQGSAGPAGDGPPDSELPEVELRVSVRADDHSRVERFTREFAPLILAGPPTVTGFAGGRPKVQEIMAFWPALVERGVVEENVSVEIVSTEAAAAGRERPA